MTLLEWKVPFWCNLFVLCAPKLNSQRWSNYYVILLQQVTVSNRKCKYLHWQKSSQGIKSTKMSPWHSGLIIVRQLKQGVATLHFDQNYTLPVVDLLWFPQHVPPPNSLNISQIHADFWKFWQNHMLVPCGWLVLPLMGNPGSAPDYPEYLDQFLTVLLETFTTVRQSKQGAVTLCFD